MLFFWRKCTDRTISEYFVIMPSSADTHIQKIAPGPPAVIAVATPTMLPVPMVPASAVVSAWKGETAPSAMPLPAPPVNRVPILVFIT